MSNYKTYAPYIVIIGLLIVLFTRKTEVKTVIIPEKTGKFEVLTPEPTVIKEVDTIKVIEFRELTPVEKVEAYKEAITPREYTKVVSDSVQEITVTANTTGSLDSLKIDYTVFEKKVPVKCKQPKYKVFLGAFTSIPTIPQQNIAIGANVSIVTPKAIYSFGYDTQRNIMLGASFKLF